MLKKIIDKKDSPFSKIAHISVVVRDIEKAVRFYEALGIGPFVSPANHEFPTRSYKGKELKSILVIKEAQIGSVILQIVEHIEGDCVAKDFLDRKGEGVYHLGFLVDNVDSEEEKILRSGIEVLQRGRRNDDSGYAYFDTESDAGVILEIKQLPLEK